MTGALLHYLLSQARKENPWQCCSEPIITPKEWVQYEITGEEKWYKYVECQHTVFEALEMGTICDPVTLLSYVHLHVEFHVSNFEIGIYILFPYPILGVLYYSIEVGGGVGGAGGNLKHFLMY